MKHILLILNSLYWIPVCRDVPIINVPSQYRYPGLGYRSCCSHFLNRTVSNSSTTATYINLPITCFHSTVGVTQGKILPNTWHVASSVWHTWNQLLLRCCVCIMHLLGATQQNFLCKASEQRRINWFLLCGVKQSEGSLLVSKGVPFLN